LSCEAFRGGAVVRALQNEPAAAALQRCEPQAAEVERAPLRATSLVERQFVAA
jgi:hypothetical protein